MHISLLKREARILKLKEPSFFPLFAHPYPPAGDPEAETASLPVAVPAVHQ